MDDDLRQLEAELSRLRPAAPPARLVARLERELAPRPSARPRAVGRWWWAVALPAAAALALVWTQVSRTPVASAPAPSVTAASAATPPMKPVAAENILVSAADEGLVTLGDGTTARRERLQFLDTVTWRNPRTNASLTWSVPREEVRVVPVSFQ